MATAQPFDLNSAVSDFSINLVRDKVTQLKEDYDRELNLDAFEIHAILQRVDQKRVKFREDKQLFLDGLRTTLSSIHVGDDTIDVATAELEKLTPKWLGIIPPALSLVMPPPPPPPPDPAAPTPPFSDMDTQEPIVEPVEPVEPRLKRRQDDAETHQRHDKRAKVDGSDDEAEEAQPHTAQKLYMSELDGIECIFTHTERDGFWVIRCPDESCTRRISDRPPDENRLAFNHFNSRHFGQSQTEEFIFNRFAYQVEDATEGAVASRYDSGNIPNWTPSREILFSTPASVPSQPPRRTRRSAARGSSEEQTSDSEPDKTPENSRHNLRQRPKPSYLNISQGRKSSTTDDQNHSSRTKPAESRKSKTSGVYKPFGHTEEWPRRSAPS